MDVDSSESEGPEKDPPTGQSSLETKTVVASPNFQHDPFHSPPPNQHLPPSSPAFLLGHDDPANPLNSSPHPASLTPPDNHNPRSIPSLERNERGFYVKKFPGEVASVLSSDGQTLSDKFVNDPIYYEERSKNMFYPFDSDDEAQFAILLDELRLSLGSIDRILKLKLIRKMNLSFTSAKSYRAKMKQLPASVPWKWQELKFPGFATKKPIIVYYRDGLDCIQSLLADPKYASDLDYVPRKEYTDAECTNRVYSEYMTGNNAWEIQEGLPAGATQTGVILSSDKTNLSQGTGNACAHPLTISTSAICAKMRNSLTAHAFKLAALIPIPRFLTGSAKIQSVLSSRILHKTYDLVSRRLKEAAKSGHRMTDSNGQIRLCYTPLVSDGGIDPDDIATFSAACVAHRLNGVDLPFWRDWVRSCPYKFLTADILHAIHRFFLDHDREWATNAIGEAELDYRYIILQPRIGFRKFPEGIATLKQVTGRDQREMEKYFTAVIGTDPVPESFVIATRALMEFRYRSQAKFITDKDLTLLKLALSEFHRHKEIMVTKKYRSAKAWRVPKMERMHYLVDTVPSTGPPSQWSTERTESAHIELVKEPYRDSNKKEYNPYICRTLQRAEQRRQYDTHIRIEKAAVRKLKMRKIVSPKKGKRGLARTRKFIKSSVSTAEDDDDEDLLARERSSADYFADAKIAAELRVANQKAVSGQVLKSRVPYSSSTPSTAFHFKYDPDVRSISVEEASERFRIPDLYEALLEFYDRKKKPSPWLVGGARPARGERNLPFQNIKVWYTVTIQNYDVDGELLPGRTIQAIERNGRSNTPKGRYDTIIINNDPKYLKPWDGSLDMKEEHFAAQLRLLFCPIWEQSSDLIQFHPHLAYIQRFDIVPQVQSNQLSSRGLDLGTLRLTNLYVLKRATRLNGERLGGVIDVRSIRIPAQLVPRYGGVADPTLTADTAMERSTEFWLNKFASKDLFFRLEKALYY
ncbi:hypothetical protein SISNIDRAFT_409274 [Sistotremastrum niveocremeum HHB9708]|uniref:DUF6830 domain-containing protein n=1 Tax=Sistotremastrum niveocremeum HHB9708 TaxID=1314777 RepID=A0A164W749_9AGAM|nr:hypothetical protein SISNIDRAFT_409274 [Sistotremastrum niveocremeum HHB9708]